MDHSGFSPDNKNSDTVKGPVISVKQGNQTAIQPVIKQEQVMILNIEQVFSSSPLVPRP
jgi:hypothetical protein